MCHGNREVSSLTPITDRVFQEGRGSWWFSFDDRQIVVEMSVCQSVPQHRTTSPTRAIQSGVNKKVPGPRPSWPAPSRPYATKHTTGGTTTTTLDSWLDFNGHSMVMADRDIPHTAQMRAVREEALLSRWNWGGPHTIQRSLD